jgi:hypothetical protein
LHTFAGRTSVVNLRVSTEALQQVRVDLTMPCPVNSTDQAWCSIACSQPDARLLVGSVGLPDDQMTALAARDQHSGTVGLAGRLDVEVGSLAHAQDWVAQTISAVRLFAAVLAEDRGSAVDGVMRPRRAGAAPPEAVPAPRR